MIMTHTTTHRGVTSTKLCTMIEGKKFCEVNDSSPQEVGLAMMGIFGGIVLWALFSFITYKIVSLWLKINFCDDWAVAVGIFSLFAPLAYFGLFLTLFG